MKSTLLFGLLILSLTGCLVSSSDDPDERLFGVWYKVETVDTQSPSPNTRVYGWKISTQSVRSGTAMGSMQPIGRNGNTAEISLIDTPYIPDIHNIDRNRIIVDRFVHPEITVDTVRYSISSDTLTLEGKHYKGTFRRIQLGTTIGEPLKSHFEVEIDGRKVENHQVDEITPTAYIRRIFSDEIQIISRMKGENITIKIMDFNGPGTYVIRQDQGFYSRFFSDMVYPSYKTQSDSSGVITIENDDFENNRYTGHFEFTAHREYSDNDPENGMEFIGVSFDLPVFE